MFPVLRALFVGQVRITPGSDPVAMNHGRMTLDKIMVMNSSVEGTLLMLMVDEEILREDRSG